MLTWVETQTGKWVGTDPEQGNVAEVELIGDSYDASRLPSNTLIGEYEFLAEAQAAVQSAWELHCATNFQPPEGESEGGADPTKPVPW